jgi:hypothetical protein
MWWVRGDRGDACRDWIVRGNHHGDRPEGLDCGILRWRIQNVLRWMQVVEVTMYADNQAKINELAHELEEFMDLAVEAGAAEVAGTNDKGHRLFRETPKWNEWCERNHWDKFDTELMKRKIWRRPVVADSEVRQKFEAWAAEHMKDGPTWAKWLACDAFSAGMRAGEIAAKELAESVAKEVGGKFWETHMLNTGLLKFLARLNALPAAPEEKKCV